MVIVSYITIMKVILTVVNVRVLTVLSGNHEEGDCHLRYWVKGDCFTPSLMPGFLLRG